MISIKGSGLSKIDRSSKEYAALQAFHERLKVKDPTIWGAEAQAEASIRMNWIDLPESSRDLSAAVNLNPNIRRSARLWQPPR